MQEHCSLRFMKISYLIGYNTQTIFNMVSGKNIYIVYKTQYAILKADNPGIRIISVKILTIFFQI